MGTGIDALQYAAANARLRGLKAQLLSRADWQELLRTKDLAGAIDVLRETAYADVVTGFDPRSQAIEDLERLLTARGAEDCRRAMTFLQGPARALLVVWWQHYELDNLKALFRGLDQNMDIARIQRFLIPLGSYSTLPWDALLHERTVVGLIDLLKDTHYINPLRNALPMYQRDHTLFGLEVALDVRYYRDLAAGVMDLHGADRDGARRIIGSRIDMLNVMWAYRFREYYKLSPEEIVNYTLWHTFKTDTNLVRDIAMGADPHDVLARVFGEQSFDLSVVGDYFQDEARGLMRLEMALERYWWHMARRELSGYPFQLGGILGYLVLAEFEIRDLVTLLETKGMGWEEAAVREHLIRDGE
jgi:V/A-type H+-transporting ATPase subunit C